MGERRAVTNRLATRYRQATWSEKSGILDDLVELTVGLAATFVGAYSVSGLISPAHFTSVAPSDFVAFQLTFIVLDTLAGVGLSAFAVWLARAGPVEA